MLQYQAQSFLDMATQWVVFLHGIYGFMNLMCRQGRQALFEQARGLFQITEVPRLEVVVCAFQQLEIVAVGKTDRRLLHQRCCPLLLQSWVGFDVDG